MASGRQHNPSSSDSGSPTGRSADAGAPKGTYFLGRYRVVDEIGVGGMATVHLARMDGEGGFQKWVAIKKVHAHLTQDEHFVNMFLDEARIAAKISHPNVAQVFELGTHEQTYWIAMEYLQGEPVREVMRINEERGQSLAPDLAACVIADAAEGLHAAHELKGKRGEPLNLVHRDVSPHNLFLTYDGQVKVVDFGIAKVSGRLSRTRAGTLKGKLAYMAPEQLRGEEVDRRTDIFALGIVLWELTTGKRLFRMDNEIDTLEKVRLCIVPPPSHGRPDFPTELESIVMRALEKDPARRFQSAKDLSRALHKYLMHAGAFVGREELAAYVTGLFTDRIKKRQEHLRWAAEATGTISVQSVPPPRPDKDLISGPSHRDDDDVTKTRQDVGGPPADAIDSELELIEDTHDTARASKEAQNARRPVPRPGQPLAEKPAELDQGDWDDTNTMRLGRQPVLDDDVVRELPTVQRGPRRNSRDNPDEDSEEPTARHSAPRPEALAAAQQRAAIAVVGQHGTVARTAAGQPAAAQEPIAAPSGASSSGGWSALPTDETLKLPASPENREGVYVAAAVFSLLVILGMAVLLVMRSC